MKIKDRFLPVITIAVILLIWYIAAIAYGIELILPSPTVAFRELITAFGESEFWSGVLNTVLRSAMAFAVGFLFALILSLLAVRFNVFFKTFYPVVVLLRALPTISVIFICYIAVKGWYRAVLISFLVIFPTLFSSFYTAFKNCNGALMEVSILYKVSAWHKITRFIIPSVWASMYSDIVNTLSLTVKLIVAAEAVTSTGNSLGGLMAESKAIIDMGRILAYTIVAIGLSYLTELIIRLSVRVVKEVSKKWRYH